MKKYVLFFILILLLLPGFSEAQKAEESPLLNKPMPFEGVTLDGKQINKAYFKGKVTLVNFMFIECRPCMKEISVLNKLH